MGLTYTEVGATRDRRVPPGYRELRRRTRIGTGPADLEAAAAAVLDWQVQRRAGMRVHATSPATPGEEGHVRIRVGPVWFRAPFRVIHVLDEPDRRGFAYGTTSGHPERGEEAFEVSIDADGAVWFDLFAFSRAGTWWSALGLPAMLAVQRFYTRRYLAAARSFVSA